MITVYQKEAISNLVLEECAASLTLSSTSNSFLEPRPSILVTAVYIIILANTNEIPSVVGE